MRFLPNGQWTLAKSLDTSNTGIAPTSLHGLVGKTHTVRQTSQEASYDTRASEEGR